MDESGRDFGLEFMRKSKLKKKCQIEKKSQIIEYDGELINVSSILTMFRFLQKVVTI